MAALSLVTLLAEIGYQTVLVAGIPLYLREVWRLEVRDIGLITTAFLIAETSTKIPFGALSDRYGRRWFVICGPLLSALSALALSQGPSPGIVVVLRAVDGLGSAMLWTALFAMIADLVEARMRATAMSLFNLTYVGGLILGPLLYSGVFARTHSYVAVFYLVAPIFCLCALVAYAVAPRGRRPVTDQQATASNGALPDASGPWAVARDNWEMVCDSWAIIRRSPVLKAMLTVAVVQFFGLQMLNGVLTIYLKEELGVSEVEFGKLFLSIGVVAGALVLPMGRLADHIGKPRAIRVGLATCAAGLCILPWVRSAPLLVPAAAVFGLGLFLAAPAWLALMTELAGAERRGGVVGIINTAQGIGACLGPGVGSSLYTHVAPRAPFFLSALLFMASLYVVFRYVRHTGSGEEFTSS